MAAVWAGGFNLPEETTAHTRAIFIHTISVESYIYISVQETFTQYSYSLKGSCRASEDSCVCQTLRDTGSWTAQSNPVSPPDPHTQNKPGFSPLSSCLSLSSSLFSSNGFAFCHSMTDSSLKCSTFSSSLSPSSLPSLHNFHTGGTRGFLIACLWKHNLFPPSSVSASSCGLVPYWQSGRQTDRVTIVYVSRKKHRKEEEMEKIGE